MIPLNDTRDETTNEDRQTSGIFALAVAGSITLHALTAAAAIYLVPVKTIAPPKTHMVVVDLVSFKGGASADRKTHVEKLSRASVRTSPPKKPKPVKDLKQSSPVREKTLPQKLAPILEKPQKPKPATLPVAKLTAPVKPVSITPPLQADMPARAKQVVNPKVKAKPRLLDKKTVKLSPPAELKPTQKRAAPKNAPTKNKPIKKSKRPTFTKGKKSKTSRKQKSSKRSIAGRGIRKKGKSKTGRTQGVRYAGAGLSNPRPSYPPSARQRNQQGRVMLRVGVSTSGRASSVRIARSSGHKVLDNAARNAVRRWRFRPATKNGKPVAATVTVPISFRLR